MTRTSACAIAFIPVSVPSGRSTALVVAASSPLAGFHAKAASDPPENARPRMTTARPMPGPAGEVSSQRLTEIEAEARPRSVASAHTSRRPGTGQRPTARARCHAGAPRVEPAAGVRRLGRSPERRSSAALSAGCRSRRRSAASAARCRTRGCRRRVIQSPRALRFEQRRQLRVERAQQRHRRAVARLERSSATPRAVAAATTSCTRLRDGLGELADAARRGVDLRRRAGRRPARRPTRRRRAAIGWPRRGRLPSSVVRVQRLDLDDQLAAEDQAEDRVVAEAGLVDPVEAHRGDDLARRGDVPIDGVEQRPPARDGGAGTKAVPFSRTVATVGCSSCSRRAGVRPIRVRGAKSLPAGRRRPRRPPGPKSRAFRRPRPRARCRPADTAGRNRTGIAPACPACPEAEPAAKARPLPVDYLPRLGCADSRPAYKRKGHRAWMRGAPGKDAGLDVSRRIITMASFSVVTNLASVNAQSNLYSTNIGLQHGADPRVERLPHQQLGRRRGRPRGGELVPLGSGGPEPGRPQRQRRSVEPADQGRRARQHLEAARSSLDAGDAGGLGPDDRRRRAPR